MGPEPKRLAVCELAIDALSLAAIEGCDLATAYLSTGGGWGDGKRQPLAAYRFGGLECMLLGPGEGGLMSMIG